ncbi:MAG TPA: polysaccharide deacetylase family protein [Solirubrobacterales bacterium]|nr:polysaccharide deacetylase family protein [Solirubrobacterales bacterium]
MDNPRATATSSPAIASPRKILCALALLASALLTLPEAAAAASPQGELLAHAGLSQAGRDLILTVRTSRPVPLSRLQARPDLRRRGASYLCFGFGRPPQAGVRLLCLGGAKAHRRIGVETVGGGGRLSRAGSIPARVKRPQPDKLVVALEPADAGLAPARYRWRVLASNGCEVPRQCVEMLPARGVSTYRLRPVRAVGCTGGSAGLVTNGPRDRKVVALTFDDGPSEYTPEFLRVLREKGVPGTFFEVGQEMPGREDVMRQILAEGDEIGDHTMNHVEFPGSSQIAGAAARIKAYTHFQPCLFRPPGGGVDSGVISTAGSLGMRTINWDVDPRDWSLPGTGAIYSNIVGHAEPGSIILMHDGGGPRSETLAALPQVIDTLRARGYGFATVSELLGYKILYRPFG